MPVNLDKLNSSMGRLLVQQREVNDREQSSVVSELFDLADRIGEIPMPKKTNALQRLCRWVFTLFGKAPSLVPAHSYLDATLAHFKGRVSKSYPKRERLSAREMTAKIFHVRRELLTPLRAHFPKATELAQLDEFLVHTRDRYGLRLADEPQEELQLRPISPSVQPASIHVDAQEWIDSQKRAGYALGRSTSGHIIAEKEDRDPEILAPNEAGGFNRLCNFGRGVANRGNHPENPSFSVSWVNGVGTKLTKTIKRAEEISSAFMSPVHYMHNPNKSLARHIGDSGNYLLGKDDSEEVLALANHFRTLLAESDRDILHLCHSQGSALTKLAARHLAEEEKERIHVLSFGGLLPIEPADGFASQKNYISKGDALIRKLNSKAERAATEAASSGSAGRAAPEHYEVIEKAKSAKKSHSIGENSPYNKAMMKALAEQREASAKPFRS